MDFDMDFDRFIVGDTEFRLQDDELKRIKGDMPEYKFKKIINALLSQVQSNTRSDIGKVKDFFKEDAEYNNIVSKVKNVRI